MAKNRSYLLVLAPFALVLFCAPAARAANQLHIESETLFRWFQGELSGDKKTGMPVYEYLRADFGALDADGFSAHLYGWGRYDFGDYYSDYYSGKSAGEFLYGYVQYSDAKAGFLARLGRQYLMQTGQTKSLDGLFLSSDLTPLFAASAYGGQPVALEEVDGRAGDALWGGRFAHHWRGLYELGVFYQRENNDGDKNSETAGFDVSVTPPWPVSLYGYSKRNLVTDGWAEHSYELRADLGALRLRPFYQRFKTGDYFDAGAGTPKPFTTILLLDGDDTVTIGGMDGSIWTAGGLEFGAKAKHYAYEEADTKSWYYAGTAIKH